ncbi:AAR2 splicing factor family protein [Aspergillus saccharolyticus JOP 1030-1]|uniref:AAR2 domain protein n=1 Tax=Aspergillus saccharolyticus JOP 1030-1 TaxID=1450539 RepID=A0A318ZU92_9EURO|nr:hypothetical protein BP01DRAFT_354763 [Aspergillus saccharolyticus JOP 1030-1]PYH47560.1 hypothetical protein BP01DRAFT_354763 [Aspergillus saccharolyticus JOP 1030-1]
MTTPTPTILLPHLPPKTLVGIDLITFTSTANFHGIRDLPRGWHFLYTGTTESLSLRCGSWFYVGDLDAAAAAGTLTHPTTTMDNNALVSQRQKQSQHSGQDNVIVWKWDAKSETLAPLSADSDADKQEAMRQKANLGAIYHRGGLFRYRSRVTEAMLAMQQQQRGAGSAVRLLGDNGDGAEDEEEDEQDGRRDWLGLTDRITPSVLDRIVGVPVVDVDGRPRWMVTSASTALRDSDAIPGLTVKEGVEQEVDEEAIERVTGEKEPEFSFVPVDLKRTWREGAIGRERTEAAQDRSWALGDLIKRVAGSSDIETDQGRERIGEGQLLGELQFSFLMILTLMNYSCLQQWKRLLELILTCRSAIRDRETFMSDLLRLLLLQLRRCDDVEGGLFDLDGDEGGAFLRKLLMKFRKSLYEVVEGTESQVKTEFEKLEAFVKEEFDWELNRDVILRRGMVQLEDGEQVELEVEGDNEDEELGEYAPMVVDLGEGTGRDDSDSLEDLN